MKTRTGKYGANEYWYEKRWWNIKMLAERYDVVISTVHRQLDKGVSLKKLDEMYGISKPPTEEVVVHQTDRGPHCAPDNIPCKDYEACWLITYPVRVSCTGYREAPVDHKPTGACHGVRSKGSTTRGTGISNYN